MYELPSEQQDLIERFEAAYNRIDRELRNRINQSDEKPFSSIVDEYERRAKGWRDGRELKRLAKLRNVVVHGKTEPYRYLAIPTPEIVNRLESLYQKLAFPKTAYTEFRRDDVVKIDIHLTLDEVLKKIYELDFSQFPVYDNKRFVGLLTENGITRWLSSYVRTHDSIVGLDEATVNEVLGREEKRPNYAFVSRATLVDEVLYKFRNNPHLEAAFVTQNGKEHEGLLGVATRWDITSNKE